MLRSEVRSSLLMLSSKARRSLLMVRNEARKEIIVDVWREGMRSLCQHEDVLMKSCSFI